MIEKLERHIREEDGVKISCPPDNAHINEKLNEIIDWINDVSALRVTDKQVTANLPNIDAGELAFLSKENTELEDDLERTRKALDVAVDVLKYANKCIKGGCVNWETEIDRAIEQIESITKGGDNE